MPNSPDRESSQMHRRIWDLLDKATASRTPFTSMQLATVDRNYAPRCRTVILRSANAENRTIAFTTDTESQKVTEIQNNPQVALTGYDQERLQQLRLSGRAVVVQDEQKRRKFWSSLDPRTHILYRSPLSPGQRIAHPDKNASEHFEGADDAGISRRFALVEIRLAHADWLNISDTPHRRFQLTWNENGVDGAWVVP